MMLAYTAVLAIKSLGGFIMLYVPNLSGYDLEFKLIKALEICAVVVIQVVLIDFIFKMKAVIDIITSESSFVIKTKLKRTRKAKYTLIILISISTVIYESVNLVQHSFPTTFDANYILCLTMSLLGRTVFLVTFLWLLYLWGVLIHKFVQKKQAKLESQLLALTLSNKFVIGWILVVSSLVVI
jgi:hypothetical protein